MSPLRVVYLNILDGMKQHQTARMLRVNSNMICVSHTNMCDTHIIDDLKSGSGTPGEKLKVFAVEKEKALF